MEEKIKKIVWEARLPILIGAFAGNLSGTDLSNNLVLYLIAFAVFVGLLDLIRKKFYPYRESNKRSDKRCEHTIWTR